MRSYGQIRAAVLAKGFQFDERAKFTNMIWERTSDEVTNHFTDWLHVCYNLQVLSIPATTKPGLKGSILEPTTVEGVTGTAVIQPGQYLKAWQFHDTIKEFSSYPYFRQVAPVNYWRDGNKDTHIDHVQDQEQKIFGTHWHRMSQTGTYGSGQVNNWSLGCMGAAEPEFKKIIPIVRDHVSKYGDKFTGIILESKDFA